MGTRVYAGRLKDHGELVKSSSGGAFTALSNAFLKNGDAVAASVYDYDTNQLGFSIITDIPSRDAARGSKYFQSNVGDVFRDGKAWLEAHPDKKLMFVGTGCQAEAFRIYAEECGLADRVVTIDIICFGVVSPEIWQSYLEDKLASQGNGDSYKGLTFKDKRNGWLHPSAFITVGGKEVPIEEYVKIFYSKNALRPSCYQCPYTSVERNTDITIGDFWGIDKRIPDFYDPMGNSLFLVHTGNGKQLFDLACEEMDYRESNAEECMQSHLEKPTECPGTRTEFWETYRQSGIHKVIKKYASDSVLGKARKRLKNGGSNGKAQKQAPEGDLIDEDKDLPELYADRTSCCGCTACFAICPAQAISMRPDEEGFLYPVVDAEKCIRCYKCLSVCGFKEAQSKKVF